MYITMQKGKILLVRQIFRKELAQIVDTARAHIALYI